MSTLAVRVIPRSANNAICGWQEGELLLRVTAAAQEGKANEAVAKLLARQLGIAKTSIRIAHGQNSRHKLLELELSAESLAQRLEAVV